MPEIPNPYQTEHSRKQSAGELAQHWARLAEVGFRLLGVSLTQQEFDGMALLIGAFIRAWPKLKEFQ